MAKHKYVRTIQEDHAVGIRLIADVRLPMSGEFGCLAKIIWRKEISPITISANILALVKRMDLR